MTTSEYWAGKAAPAGSSVYYAFLFLPAPQKSAATALYALAHEAQDIIARAHEPTVAHAKLAWWRAELARLGCSSPTHPITLALKSYVASGHLTLSSMEQLFDGIEMDLAQTRYLDYRGVERYCELVSGTVAQALAQILGAADDANRDYGRQLGIALRLTEIVCNVGEDARRGRVYLPLDELKQFGVTVADILSTRKEPAFVELMQFQSERIKSLYHQARGALALPEKSRQRPGLIMAAHAEALLAELERDDFPVLQQRVNLTPIRKLFIAWRVWITRGQRT